VAAAGCLAATPQFKTDAVAIRVDVLVTDGNRRPISGLTRTNFEIRDNGKVETIAALSVETMPLCVIAMLDVSASITAGDLGHLKQAYLAVVGGLLNDDRATLVTFSSGMRLHSPLTGDRARLRSLVDGVLATGGTTSLFDALYAVMSVPAPDDCRLLMILLSDGRDTSSWLSVHKVIDSVGRTDLVLYPVTIGRPKVVLPRITSRSPNATTTITNRVIVLSSAAELFLQRLADDTGGRVMYANDNAALGETFLAVLQEFRHRYVLTYQPREPGAKGWHDLDVKLKGRTGQVRARRGYFAR
jgi:VWFA-related protein